MESNLNQHSSSQEFISAIISLEKIVLSNHLNVVCDLLTFNQTKKLLNCTDSWLRKSVFEKSIPYKKLGKNLRFSKEELFDWVEESSVKPQ